MIVLYRLSTSNHNPPPRRRVQPLIVLYRLSTSNHNPPKLIISALQLSYIVFLHQTTTTRVDIYEFKELSYIVFLHQTTTDTLSINAQ